MVGATSMGMSSTWIRQAPAEARTLEVPGEYHDFCNPTSSKEA